MKSACRLLALVALSAAPVLAADPQDWTYWRGPNYNGTSYATGLPDRWDPSDDEQGNVRWQNDELGGRSTPVVMDGRLYTILRADPGTEIEGERVVCVDAETGELLWENRFNVYLSDVPDTRVGWSSVVADPETGNVYALGVSDLFLCIDGETGETVWSVPLHEEYGMLSTYGGRTNFPIISDRLVIISGIIIGWGEQARPNHRLIAFNKRTGENVWFSGTRDLPDDTTYSGPSLKVINGQKTLVLGAGDGSVWGVQPRTGRPVWDHPVSRRGLFATPLVVGNRVYASHSEENPTGQAMGAVAAFEVTGAGGDAETRELWRVEEIVAGRSAPVYHDGRLYVVDDRAKLWVLDAETGEEVSGRPMTLGDRRAWASLLLADGKLYAFTENGRWAILGLDGDEIEFLDRGRSRVRGESFIASPIVAGGRLYVQSTAALYCLEDPQKEAGYQADAAPEEEQEAPVEEHPDPAFAVISPTEMLLEPGESQELTVRVFNRLGQLLGEAPPTDVDFTVDGPANVSGGVLRTAPADEHAAARITARVGDVSAQARARIVPPLPWRFTFDDLDDAPVTWIGARYRHVIRPIDDSPALVKITTIPKGTRSRSMLGPSDLANYTIAADVKGQTVGGQMPDIGLIAQGYTLDLQGNAQALQIRSWDAQLRMAETVDFAWEAGTWYRMKLRAETIEEEGPDGEPQRVALLRGKVWPRDAEEPEAWTIEARDRSPNLSGSPGLFGNARTSELYVDNVEVTEND